MPTRHYWNHVGDVVGGEGDGILLDRVATETSVKGS